jgi:hypothetical protein
VVLSPFAFGLTPVHAFELPPRGGTTHVERRISRRSQVSIIVAQLGGLTCSHSDHAKREVSVGDRIIAATSRHGDRQTLIFEVSGLPHHAVGRAGADVAGLASGRHRHAVKADQPSPPRRPT